MMKRMISIIVIPSLVLSSLIAGQLLISTPVIAPDPAGLPDLTISEENISISSTNPTVGDLVVVNATIWNVGTADATNVEVNFYEEDTLIGSENIDVPVNGTWIYHTIDSTGNVGGHSSIVVDNENGVHISYLDSTNDDLNL